jgi:hypothetical protein
MVNILERSLNSVNTSWTIALGIIYRYCRFNDYHLHAVCGEKHSYSSLMTKSQSSQLTSTRARLSHGEAQDLISGFIRLTIQTGLMTSVLALLVVPLFVERLDGIYTLP